MEGRAAPPHRSKRSQQAVLRWGLVLLGTALLVGVLAAWWLSRQVGRLQRYARSAFKRLPGESLEHSLNLLLPAGRL